LNAVAFSGSVVDTIQHLIAERKNTLNEDGVYDGEPAVQIQYSWFAEVKALVHKHIPDVYPTGQPKDEALWRTLIGDVGLDEVHPAPPDYSDYYQLWCRILADIDTFVGHCKRDVLPPGYSSEQELMDAIFHYTRFNSAYGQFTSGRRFCVTKNGYIGMVPPGTEPGDLVCILFGADTPFVIRDTTAPRRMLNSYTLVGDCYIHGMMDGEALEPYRPEQCIILW
jgi:hypothetical protein